MNTVLTFLAWIIIGVGITLFATVAIAEVVNWCLLRRALRRRWFERTIK